MKIEEVRMEPSGAIVDRNIVEASFEEWIAHVFDHPDQPSNAPDWWWDEDSLHWAAPASDTIGFLTKTFENSASLFQKFTTKQVALGLEYISNVSCSDISLTLNDISVPWPARKKCLGSIKNLYAGCFQSHCDPQLLSHLVMASDDVDKSGLNGVCYMWWDVLPMRFDGMGDVGASGLDVMEFALILDSDACRESALHGLGHWFSDFPKQVHRLIDDFISRNPHMRPELLAYAKRAREGNVL